MRIAISTSVIQSGKSGVGQYVIALVKALLPFSEQHTIHLLALEEDMSLFNFAAGRMGITAIKGIPSANPVQQRAREAINDIAWHQFILPKWLRENEIDVLHVPCHRRMLYSAPSALVATIHDLGLFHVAPEYSHDWARRAYARIMVRRLAARQQKIIVVSENTARDVERFYNISPERIHVIYNGVDQERFVPGDQAYSRVDTAVRWGTRSPVFSLRIENRSSSQESRSVDRSL